MVATRTPFRESAQNRGNITTTTVKRVALVLVCLSLALTALKVLKFESGELRDALLTLKYVVELNTVGMEEGGTAAAGQQQQAVGVDNTRRRRRRARQGSADGSPVLSSPVSPVAAAVFPSKRATVPTENTEPRHQYDDRQQQQQNGHHTSIQLGDDNYNDRLFSATTEGANATSSSLRKSVPLPVQVIERYIRWHSDDALRADVDRHLTNNNDSNVINRKYAVGMYQCPNAAGNRIHEFINDLLFCIVTNRTLLWKYYDNATCQEHSKLLIDLKVPGKYPLKACSATNAVHDCEAMINRRNWVPSYDAWRSKLGLSSASTKPVFLKGLRKGVDHPVVIFHHKSYSLNVREMRSFSDKQTNDSPWAKSTVRDLYKLGAHFVYGMGFNYLFDFSNRIKAIVPDQFRTNPPSSTAFTIGVHSRHTNEGDDGCVINREMKCLEDILREIPPEHKHKPCQLFVMSDRECTLTRLRSALQPGSFLFPDGSKRTCTVHVPPHESHAGLTAEHGPFAGAGFFQDLAFVTGAVRHSLITGRKHSSSLFLNEMVTYNRVLEAWRGGKSVASVPEMKNCFYVEKGSAAAEEWFRSNLGDN